MYCSIDVPYIIACNNEKLFLKVQPDGSVVACDNVREASEFYIIPTDNKAHPYDFHIAFYDNTPQTPHAATANPLNIAKPCSLAVGLLPATWRPHSACVASTGVLSLCVNTPLKATAAL